MKLKMTGLKVDAKGEGSRGGRVIGHTSSGKPVYANKKPHKSMKIEDLYEHTTTHINEAARNIKKSMKKSREILSGKSKDPGVFLKSAKHHKSMSELFANEIQSRIKMKKFDRNDND